MNQLKLKLVSIVIGIVTAFVLAEVLIRLFLPNPALVPRTGSIEAPKAKLYGWHMFPNTEMIHINPDDINDVSYYFTNSEGWKDVEHDKGKKEGTKRILVLGDSNTMGVVPLENVYTRLLQQRIDSCTENIEIISMGMQGWGTDQVFEALMQEGFDYHPDMVIYQFCSNDIIDNDFDVTIKSDHPLTFKPFRYRLEKGELTKEYYSQKDYPLFFKVKRALLKSAVIFQVNRLYKIIGEKKRIKQQWFSNYPIKYAMFAPENESYLAVRDSSFQVKWELFAALLRQMNEQCKKNGAELIVFSESTGEKGALDWELLWNRLELDEYGNQYIVDGGVKQRIDYAQPYKFLNQVCQDLYLELIPNKRSYSRYKYDPHPNIQGNINMAADVFDYLRQHELLSNTLCAE